MRVRNGFKWIKLFAVLLKVRIARNLRDHLI